LLCELKRKTLQAIALAYRGAKDVRNMTNFMTRSKWEDRQLKEAYQTDLAAVIGVEGGMITGDESGIPKKGKESVGVARQYCGNTGKIDNCQVGVMAGYVSDKGYGIVDYDLFMPESWFGEDQAVRRKKCGVPSGVGHRTKNEILLGQITAIYESGKFPAKYVGVDSGYGRDGKFLDSLPGDLIYFADVPYDTLVFATRPQTFVPEYSGKGKKPVKMKTDTAPLSVKAIAENSETPWNTAVLGIGAKGPVIAHDKVIPVVEVRDGLPRKDVWLYVRKLEDGKIKYALCNAASDADANEVRKPALMRWPIEQCFHECKKYLGMDQYETRSWDAWRRHMLLCFISHLFITKLKIAFNSIPDTPSPTPHVDVPVSFADYVQADEQMLCGESISNPDIMAAPTAPQGFLTIGLLCKLVDRILIRTGEVLKEIDFMLRSARDAFKSHSRSRLNKAKAIYAGNQ
jgi:SRSO17 transposase